MNAYIIRYRKSDYDDDYLIERAIHILKYYKPGR